MAERIYRIQKAAELSGVSEELIRAWERRYAVLEPERTESGYRLYSELDVALLKRLRELTETGTPISQAARIAPDLRRELEQALEARAKPEPGATALEQWRLDLLRAAERVDPVRLDRVLDEALASLPPLRVYDELIFPSLVEIGERWHAGTFDVGQEHAATQVMRTRVMALVHGAPGGHAPHVVCACFPEEQHELGALGVVLRLRHEGFRVTWLGQRTPATELGAMTRRVRPKAVLLSAVTDPGEAEFARTAKALRGAVPKEVPIVAGGRAASLHRPLAERNGMRVFAGADWPALVAELRGA